MEVADLMCRAAGLQAQLDAHHQEMDRVLVRRFMDRFCADAACRFPAASVYLACAQPMAAERESLCDCKSGRLLRT
jgi:hypothetical protein